MASNVLARIYSNRNLAGPDFTRFDNRIVAGLNVPAPFQNSGRTMGFVPFPASSNGSVSTGRAALSILAIGVLALVAFNVWTREFRE